MQAWRVGMLVGAVDERHAVVVEHPEMTDEGLATAACARLCRVLLADGIDVISLNVHADNAAAIRAYEKLGFAHATDYVEVMLSRGQR